MTPWAKVTYSAALLIGLSLGAFFGFQDGALRVKAYLEFRRLSPTALRDFSYLQYKHADFEHAEAALLTYVNILEEMEELRPEESQNLELANAYTRLALLEDAVQNAEQSHAYMTKARHWYTAKCGKEYPDSEMKAGLQKMDAEIDAFKEGVQR